MKYLVLNEIGIGNVISGTICPNKNPECNSYCPKYCPSRAMPPML